MDLRRCGWIRTLLVLGCLVIGCTAGNLWQKTEEKSIICYQCNSEYDPRCGDPFDPYTLGTVNCSMKKHLDHLTPEYKPVLCRKTTQKVQGKTRVIRGCGYVRDERDDKQCMRRLGTHEVIVNYCSCTKNLCNSAFRSTLATPPYFILPTLLVIMGLMRS